MHIIYINPHSNPRNSPQKITKKMVLSTAYYTVRIMMSCIETLRADSLHRGFGDQTNAITYLPQCRGVTACCEYTRIVLMLRGAIVKRRYGIHKTYIFNHF